MQLGFPVIGRMACRSVGVLLVVVYDQRGGDNCSSKFDLRILVLRRIHEFDIFMVHPFTVIDVEFPRLQVRFTKLGYISILHNFLPISLQ